MQSNTKTGLATGIGLTVFFIVLGLLKAGELTINNLMRLIVVGIIAGTIGGFVFGWIMGKFRSIPK